MTTVDDAVEAGARAMGCEPGTSIHSWRCEDKLRYPEACTCTAGVAHEAARAMWPILSAGLRAINTGDNRALYGNDFEAGMAKALWLVKGELDRIDKELGNE